eukprot:TRINITY_DN3548_c0_g2_i3.p1 TRINITY_DN3548_c0_g2~~TRINITY_DN3548_c0_g2_i3.p1  ORF type:complete len:324 (+),score=57.89 TRINITY_DN3548_c0_g2_i3:84-1055(+)
MHQEKGRKFAKMGAAPKLVLPTETQQIQDDEFASIKLSAQITDNEKAGRDPRKKGVEDRRDQEIGFEGKIDRQSVSMDILKRGYLQAYLDFFYVTHNCVPEIIQPSRRYREDLENRKILVREYEQTREKLEELRDNLIKAEQEARGEDKNDTVERYLEIADNFYHIYQNYQFAAYFYRKSMKICASHEAGKWEGLCNMGFGMCHAKLGKAEEAIKFLEDASKKEAEVNGFSKNNQKISKELIDICHLLAAKYENENDEKSINQALYYYEKCYAVKISLPFFIYQRKLNDLDRTSTKEIYATKLENSTLKMQITKRVLPITKST